MSLLVCKGYLRNGVTFYWLKLINCKLFFIREVNAHCFFFPRRWVAFVFDAVFYWSQFGCLKFRFFKVLLALLSYQLYLTSKIFHEWFVAASFRLGCSKNRLAVKSFFHFSWEESIYTSWNSSRVSDRLRHRLVLRFEFAFLDFVSRGNALKFIESTT